MRRNMGKACLGISIILLSIYAATINSPTNIVMASEPFPSNRPVLFTDPDTIQGDVGEEFQVWVKVFNLTDSYWTDPINQRMYLLGNLWAVEMNMSWDPAILEHVSHTAHIPVDDYPDGVLWRDYTIVEEGVNPTAGYYKMAYTCTGIYTPVFNNDDQNSTVFDITFRVLKKGACALKLTQVTLGGKDNKGYIKRILHEGYDVDPNKAWGRGAIFTTPGAPVARFSVWPADLSAGVNKPVMFNASESYDTDGGTIDDYAWDFGDGNTGTGQVISHTYTAVGDYTISLRVQDNDGIESLPFERTIRVVNMRDVLVQRVSVPSIPIVHGTVAEINVTVISNSPVDVPESFNVTLFYRDSASTNGWAFIGKQMVSGLTADELLAFSWNTTGTPKPAEGESYFYRVLANATYVPHEANLTNNSLESLSLIEVPGGNIHDVAIIDLDAAVVLGAQTYTSVFILGEEVTVRFQVKNNGTIEETYNITLSCVARNGTLLLPAKEWPNQLIGYGEQIRYNFSTIALPAGGFNVTIRADIAEDRNPANNYGVVGNLRVVKPPTIEISYPSNIYANQSATFDAAASRHQDAEAQIVTYTWDKHPEAEVYGDVKEGTSVSYTFSTVGNWTVRLRIKDNFGLTFDPSRPRPATNAYLKEIVVVVQAGSEDRGGWGIDPLYIVAAVVVIAIVAVVVIRVIRKPKPSA